MFGQDFVVKVWSKDFELWNLIKICVRTCFFGKQNSTLGSVVPLAMFCLYVHRLCVFMIIPILVMLVILLILGKFFVVKESFVYLFQEQPIKK